MERILSVAEGMAAAERGQAVSSPPVPFEISTDFSAALYTGYEEGTTRRLQQTLIPVFGQAYSLPSCKGRPASPYSVRPLIRRSRSRPDAQESQSRGVKRSIKRVNSFICSSIAQPTAHTIISPRCIASSSFQSASAAVLYDGTVCRPSQSGLSLPSSGLIDKRNGTNALPSS